MGKKNYHKKGHYLAVNSIAKGNHLMTSAINGKLLPKSTRIDIDSINISYTPFFLSVMALQIQIY